MEKLLKKIRKHLETPVLLALAIFVIQTIGMLVGISIPIINTIGQLGSIGKLIAWIAYLLAVIGVIYFGWALVIRISEWLKVI
jgi:uncharacterized membrane protein YjfL (UPF0719 family)